MKYLFVKREGSLQLVEDIAYKVVAYNLFLFLATLVVYRTPGHT